MSAFRGEDGPSGGDLPRFPAFRPLELYDRELIAPRLSAYGPVTSEFTFAYLFAWRHHYQTRWSVMDEHLVFLLHADDPRGFALPPIGPGNRTRVVRRLLDWMRAGGRFADARLERADRRLVDELAAPGGAHGFSWEPVRDDFDYVYRRDELAELPGRHYHAKRNHLHRAVREWDPAYVPLAPEHVPGCLALLTDWCASRRCDEDLSLAGDREATRELLGGRESLGLIGGAALVDGAVRAFTLGERLNDTTAVVRTEKADPDMPPLYAFVNQRFAAESLKGFMLINREKDLGEAGLRRAKQSYHPCRLEEKFRVRLA